MKIFIVFIILFSSLNLFSTAQIPDNLIYKGKRYNLYSNPLETYFKKYPNKKPHTTVGSSALWRGYVATFEIKDKKLILKDIKVMKDFDSWGSVKKEVIKKDKNFSLDYFTGILVIPYGKMINYVHMGYASTYENYILLEIRNGKLTGKKDLDVKKYKLFKEIQFSEFKKTDKYKKIYKEIIEAGNDPKFANNFIKDFIISYTSRFLEKDNKTSK